MPQNKLIAPESPFKVLRLRNIGITDGGELGKLMILLFRSKWGIRVDSYCMYPLGFVCVNSWVWTSNLLGPEVWLESFILRYIYIYVYLVYFWGSMFWEVPMSTYNIFVVKTLCIYIYITNVCLNMIWHNCKPSGYARVLHHLRPADQDFHSSFPQWSPTRVVNPAAADYEPLNGPCKSEASLVDGASIWLSSWDWDV